MLLGPRSRLPARAPNRDSVPNGNASRKRLKRERSFTVTDVKDHDRILYVAGLSKLAFHRPHACSRIRSTERRRSQRSPSITPRTTKSKRALRDGARALDSGRRTFPSARPARLEKPRGDSVGELFASDRRRARRGKCRVASYLNIVKSELRANVTLEHVAIDAYVRDVLPESFVLWGNGRDFETYAADLRAMASTTYAKRRPFVVGVREGDRYASTCKTYDRELRWHERALRAMGIGAVFTAQALRGRGYATVMLGALLDAERASGGDLAYLYSDIHPAYYEKLGFVALPSRLISIRAESLDGSPSGARPIEDADWTGIRRCFDALDRTRSWSLRRTPLVWNWMRGRWRAAPPLGTQNVALVVRSGRSVIAYAIGRRALRSDAFVIDDFAFDGDAGRAIVPALLRAASGDLRRVSGWLPPPGAREVLPRGSVRARKDAVLMIAPLSALGRAWWAEHETSIFTGRADATWSSDHV